MTISQDNGYISNYLIHWTGRDGDDRGAEFLSSIASTCKLRLSYNKLHIFDFYHEIREKMVCFTDVPLAHSAEHCKRYGRFGIAFHKLKLMNVGAQPVFYASHACKRDMDVIFKFLQDQARATTIDPTLFRALHRHFYFIQRLSDDRRMAKILFITNGNGALVSRRSYPPRSWIVRTQGIGVNKKVTLLIQAA